MFFPDPDEVKGLEMLEEPTSQLQAIVLDRLIQKEEEAVKDE